MIIIVTSISWEKAMAPHSSTLAWRIPWAEKPGGLQSMGFSRQEYWSRLPFPPPGNFPDPGIEPVSPEFPALVGRFFTTELPGKSLLNKCINFLT